MQYHYTSYLNVLPKKQRNTKNYCSYYTIHPSSQLLSPENAYMKHNDTNLTRLRHFIAINQPPHNDPNLREYYRLFSDLSIKNDIIHRGDQTLLPKSLQQEAISLAPEGLHPGQDAIKRRLRAHFWFPRWNTAMNTK